MQGKSDKSKPAGYTQAGLPLLYRQPAQLDAIRHAGASINNALDLSYAKNTNSIPLNALEFVEIAKTYPIVFTNSENPIPVAIVGLEQENYFVRTDNSWLENVYIPAYVRQYPFIFFEKPEDKKFYLCIDEYAPGFNRATVEGAHRLYKDNGEPSEFTNNALKFCTSFYQHHLITANFCADMKLYKLLVPYESETTLPSGKKAHLSGFQMIDEKALKTLPDKSYIALRDKGWLPFIYMALASTSNWKNLVAIAPR